MDTRVRNVNIAGQTRQNARFRMIVTPMMILKSLCQVVTMILLILLVLRSMERLMKWVAFSQTGDMDTFAFLVSKNTPIFYLENPIHVNKLLLKFMEILIVDLNYNHKNWNTKLITAIIFILYQLSASSIIVFLFVFQLSCILFIIHKKWSWLRRFIADVWNAGDANRGIL